ncbi:ABC transporter ATP-binding protein [Gangjinia marincola]|uniref:ABC transporter ATP-binding protein n=1 Tax=Gangjinia marincola TaxID=578463 RepID=A0ABP3XUD7_9FLAO
MEYLKKILRFAGPYKKYAYLNIFFNVLYALFSAISFIALIPMLDVLFDTTKKVSEEPVLDGIGDLKDYMREWLGYYVSQQTGDDPSKALLVVIVLILILFFFKNLFGYLANYFITFLRNGILKDIRNAMYAKITALPISFYSEKKKGDVIARITSDVLEVQNSFLSILELIIREPLTIIFTIGMMLLISPELTVFVFIFIPVSGFLISRIGKSLKKRSDRVQKEQGNILSIVEETLGGLRVIKAFNAEGQFYQWFDDSTRRFFKFSNSVTHRQNLASPTSEFLGIAVIGVILWFGGRMVLLDESLDGSEFIAYMGLAYGILTPAKAISKASYSVKRGNAAAERILEVLETTNEIADSPTALEKDDFTHSITFENVSFKYDQEYVIDELNITIPKGKTVALVGQSGSGKSTIANLVTRFYDVNKGGIRIDGTDLRDMTQASLRSLMGLVTQDSILFNDSVRNNIAMGKPEASKEEIKEALQIANAWEFVKELPQGLDTNIGDSGNKLSGGQKQRLSIARAVLKNPPIMVLDEATSALDTESERLVQDALENMMKNRTSIVIAHRLSTIQNADEIIVMHKGKVVEQGKHLELIAQNGTYKKLVTMQSFD